MVKILWLRQRPKATCNFRACTREVELLTTTTTISSLLPSAVILINFTVLGLCNVVGVALSADSTGYESQQFTKVSLSNPLSLPRKFNFPDREV